MDVNFHQDLFSCLQATLKASEMSLCIRSKKALVSTSRGWNILSNCSSGKTSKKVRVIYMLASQSDFRLLSSLNFLLCPTCQVPLPEGSVSSCASCDICSLITHKQPMPSRPGLSSRQWRQQLAHKWAAHIRSRATPWLSPRGSKAELEDTCSAPGTFRQPLSYTGRVAVSLCVCVCLKIHWTFSAK